MENVTSTFSSRLKELRGNKNQSIVAEEIGISRAALSYYESGERKPDINTLYALAKYYHVTSDYLLGLTDVAAPNIDKQAIAEKTGLSERAISHLEFLKKAAPDKEFEQRESAIHDLLTLKTINILLEAEEDLLLNNLTYYFFVHFTHFGDWYGETEDTHPISDLSLYDNFLRINYSDDYDFFSNAFLLMIEKDLRQIRNNYSSKIANEFEQYRDKDLTYAELFDLINDFFRRNQPPANPYA